MFSKAFKFWVYDWSSRGLCIRTIHIYIYSEYVVGGVAVLHLVVFSTDPPSTAWELKSIRKIPASLGRE